MARYNYPQEVHDFVKEWSPKLRDKELAPLVNEKFGTEFTDKSLKAFRGNHKYYNGKKQYTKEEYWKYQTKYPQGMYEFIRDNSWGVSSKDMAEMVEKKFGVHFSPTGMKQFRQRQGIKSGVTGWFQKGHPPGNKGKKQTDYMSPETIERTKATRFQKGQKPPNLLPVGTVVVNSYGYLLRKKQMEGTQWERWEFLHRAIWEEANGPIPKNHILIFLDGDKSNCTLDNLALISSGENSVMNHSHLRFDDPDSTRVGIQIAKVKIKIAERTRHHEQTNKSNSSR